MKNDRDVVVLSAVRTAVGKYGGALRHVPPTELGATLVRESIKRAAIIPNDVGQVVFGNVIHTEAKDMYFARVVGDSRRCAGGGSVPYGQSPMRQRIAGNRLRRPKHSPGGRRTWRWQEARRA